MQTTILIANNYNTNMVNNDTVNRSIPMELNPTKQYLQIAQIRAELLIF